MRMGASRRATGPSTISFSWTDRSGSYRQAVAPEEAHVAVGPEASVAEPDAAREWFLKGSE